jgi:hypothetical protein
MDAQSMNMVRIQNKRKSIAKSTGPDEIRSSWFKENVILGHIVQRKSKDERTLCNYGLN